MCIRDRLYPSSGMPGNVNGAFNMMIDVGAHKAVVYESETPSKTADWFGSLHYTTGPDGNASEALQQWIDGGHMDPSFPLPDELRAQAEMGNDVGAVQESCVWLGVDESCALPATECSEVPAGAEVLCLEPAWDFGPDAGDENGAYLRAVLEDLGAADVPTVLRIPAGDYNVCGPVEGPLPSSLVVPQRVIIRSDDGPAATHFFCDPVNKDDTFQQVVRLKQGAGLMGVNVTCDPACESVNSTIRVTSVSYTHLTLPTICSV